ncbi:hypothetical protein E2C01_010202 [Portunus trituberculatus]|uniref:Uncharacterized protein n=1 Tax=Portunus trituberculatus TaxID=210409 RepID=A0A5B7D7R0_PORTR|nr:hypothetical protein [Portunus trituberculatus]
MEVAEGRKQQSMNSFMPVLSDRRPLMFQLSILSDMITASSGGDPDNGSTSSDVSSTFKENFKSSENGDESSCNTGSKE